MKMKLLIKTIKHINTQPYQQVYFEGVPHLGDVPLAEVFPMSLMDMLEGDPELADQVPEPVRAFIEWTKAHPQGGWQECEQAHSGDNYQKNRYLGGGNGAIYGGE